MPIPHVGLPAVSPDLLLKGELQGAIENALRGCWEDSGDAKAQLGKWVVNVDKGQDDVDNIEMDTFWDSSGEC